jgi:hypothetical protein
MFIITRDTTVPTTTITPSTISIPCFQLTNSLPNFSPMFQLEHINEIVETLDDYVFSFSPIPSQYQVVELDILSPNIVEELETLYLNGVEYQNLLSVDKFNVMSNGDETLVSNIDTLPANIDSLFVEEREST